ncbi:efflux RND transporter periplasmic adaptor subunit [Tateyamaria pelophila]|uniref:efflux RND transporter periplasmic adaptor subunit n=1 Tax=Tateyamaria pelophila TaxID=328415 RepID=UPI001CBF887D|nr:efflux RND transporter periplasmic adaptor subunit [Tateyamaria pelophila]
MKAIRQVIVCLVIVAAGIYILGNQVPAAQGVLDRFGLLAPLGIERAEEGVADTTARRPRSGATQVITTTVGEQVLADRITAIGDGRAKFAVTVRSNAVGVITDLSLTAGSYVQAGTVIARLRDEAEQIAHEMAQIELEDARIQEQRVARLETAGAVTEVRRRETEVAVRTAELAVRQAEFDLSQRQVMAPISGWVGLIDVQEGDRVNAQDILTTISDRSDILIDFRVPERVVGKMRLGQQIEVMPLGLRNVLLAGEIAAIDSVVDRASRTLLVRGRVANTDDRLRAGMAFSVAMSFPGETLLSIAPLALQWSSEGAFVWTVRDGKAMQATVDIVQRNSDAVLVASDDLKVGEIIVTEGVQTLRKGAEVETVEHIEPPATGTKAETL